MSKETVSAASIFKQTPDPLTPIPVPPQAPVTEGFAQVPGAKLWYWDTGGAGVPVILVHPASGSGMIWGYQQPAFSKAGYRVIGYSRRGFWKSENFNESDPGTASVDLHHLTQHLGLTKFHLVGSAAGGSVVSDYASSHPDRLYSLTVSSNPCGIRTGYISEKWQSIRPDGWEDYPRWFWEVGPSYRTMNPEGLKAWNDLEHKSGGHGKRQNNANNVSHEMLEKRDIPTLLLTGEADLATPPSITRMAARHLPKGEVAIVPEAGHSLYWERPDIFNRVVLDFIGRNGIRK